MDKKTMIQSRRMAREFAFKLIYESNVQKDKDIPELIEDTETAQEFAADKVTKPYIRTVLNGVTVRLLYQLGHGQRLIFHFAVSPFPILPRQRRIP